MNGSSWTDADDAAVVRLRRADLEWSEIGRRMGRTGQACANRHSIIRGRDAAVAADRSTDADMARASAKLLRALIRYGLRHDTHLGMGAAAFLATAHELGVQA